MKRKRVGRSYMGMPWDVIRSGEFARLSGTAVKMLIEIRAQYRGHNNGNLIATWSSLSKRGWRSKETVNMALHELIYYGFIAQTRKGKKLGGSHYPSLYALTWEAIDDCGKGFTGGLTPTNDWKVPRAPWVRPKRKPRRPQLRKPLRPSTDTVSVPLRKSDAA